MTRYRLRTLSVSRDPEIQRHLNSKDWIRVIQVNPVDERTVDYYIHPKAKATRFADKRMAELADELRKMGIGIEDPELLP